RRARLELALVADLVLHDRNIRADDDLLLAVLVFHHDGPSVDAGNGIADRAVGHGATGGAVPVGAMAVTGAAHRLREDVHFDRLLAAVWLRQRSAADVVAF